MWCSASTNRTTSPRLSVLHDVSGWIWASRSTSSHTQFPTPQQSRRWSRSTALMFATVFPSTSTANGTVSAVLRCVGSGARSAIGDVVTGESRRSSRPSRRGSAKAISAPEANVSKSLVNRGGQTSASAALPGVDLYLIESTARPRTWSEPVIPRWISRLWVVVGAAAPAPAPAPDVGSAGSGAAGAAAGSWRSPPLSVLISARDRGVPPFVAVPLRRDDGGGSAAESSIHICFPFRPVPETTLWRSADASSASVTPSATMMSSKRPSRGPPPVSRVVTLRTLSPTTWSTSRLVASTSGSSGISFVGRWQPLQSLWVCTVPASWTLLDLVRDAPLVEEETVIPEICTMNNFHIHFHL
eukprot:m.157588 g.157588  ORF g.157588 m.157588 type:complete len:357 (+) comp23671_c0_seq1:579-1649(+)